jgi:hypothetical protein
MPSKPKPKTTRKAKTTKTKKTRARSYNVGGQVAPAELDPKARKSSNAATLTKEFKAPKASNATAARFNAANSAAARRANFNQSQGRAAPQELINAFLASQRGNAGKSTLTPSQRQLQQAQAGIKGAIPKREREQMRLQEQALRMQQQQALQQAGRGRQQQGKYGFADPKLDQRYGLTMKAEQDFNKQLAEKYKGQRNVQLTPSEKRQGMSINLRQARLDLQRPNISARDKQNVMNRISMLQQEMRKLGGSGRGGNRTTGRPPRPPAGLGTGPTRNRPVRGRGVKPTTRPRPRPPVGAGTGPTRNRPATRSRPTTRPRPRPTPTRRTLRNRSRFMGRR